MRWRLWLTATSSRSATLESHDLLRTCQLRGEFFAALPDQLVPDPVYQVHQVERLEFGPASDVYPEGIWQHAQEERLDGGGTHFLAVLEDQVEPVVDCLAQILEVPALRKIQEL